MTSSSVMSLSFLKACLANGPLVLELGMDRPSLSFFFQKLSRLYLRREAEVTGQQVTSHCISRCIVLSSDAPGWIRRRASPIRCRRWPPSTALSAEVIAPPSEEQE